jgi:hypothetical protein
MNRLGIDNMMADLTADMALQLTSDYIIYRDEHGMIQLDSHHLLWLAARFLFFGSMWESDWMSVKDPEYNRMGIIANPLNSTNG